MQSGGGMQKLVTSIPAELLDCLALEIQAARRSLNPYLFLKLKHTDSIFR